MFLSALDLFIGGLGVPLTTGASLLKAGGWQVALGLLAALVTVVEETPGVYRCQLIQTARSALAVRLSVTNQTEEQHIWNTLRQRLSQYLSEQGVTGVIIEQAAETPRLHP